MEGTVARDLRVSGPLELRIGPGLAELASRLDQVARSAERVFLEIGGGLGHSMEVFEQLTSRLALLAEDLSGSEAGEAIAALEETVRKLDRLGQESQIPGLLSRLDQAVSGAAGRAALLERIVGEIGALAINGKIQAAMVGNAGVDFSLFTTETGRLGEMAGRSAKQMAARLQDVRSAVGSALAAADSFEKVEAKELVSVRGRIDASLRLLAERRAKAAAAADLAASKAGSIAQRIAATIVELQINDAVCQRLDHVGTALALAESALNSSSGQADREVAGGLLYLQAAQLRAAAGDYHDQVEGLIRNLSGLASDATEILSEADAAFGGTGGGLFVEEIAADIDKAAGLLAAYAKGRDQIRKVVGSVSDAFRAMTADLAAIRSIDADMRVMGLNATLKCGRLGGAGRALGVIAQELRACSKRTEECTRQIGLLLGDAVGLSESLAVASAEEARAEADVPLGGMTNSVNALSSLGRTMSRSLDELRSGATEVSRNLEGTASGIDVHQRLQQAAESGAAGLVRLADPVCAESQLDGKAQDEIRRLVFGNYTMERERLVHRRFVGEDVAETAQESDAGDIDDLFL